MDAAAIAKQAGIVGAGGAGFPTHIKLAAKADCFIVNAAECEPLVEVDKFLVRTRPFDLVSGAVAMAKAVGAGSVVFAIKKVNEREVSCLKTAIAEIDTPGDSSFANDAPDISLLCMRSFYPAGDEQIISVLQTGRSVPERGLPLDVGLVVDNVATVLNYFDACRGKSVTHRVLSVTGAVREPLMLRVPIGTDVKLCVEAAGGSAEGSSVVMGGPMMGAFHDSSEVDRLYIKKTDGNILVLPPGNGLYAKSKMDMLKLRNRARSACIRCRICTDLCPRYMTGHNMTPHTVMQNLFRIDSITCDTEFEKAFGSAANCSECGVCENYACPMVLSPRRVNALVKQMLRERGIDPIRNTNPQMREFFEERLVPTKRLTARLGLAGYKRFTGNELVELNPARVTIPLLQHIGMPCVPCVQQGKQVVTGDLIASPPEGKLGANIHASIDGAVVSINNEYIVLEASG